MTRSQKQAVEVKAEELYSLDPVMNALRKEFIEGATFGLSLQTNEWVSVDDRLPTKDDGDNYSQVLAYDSRDDISIQTTGDMQY